MKSSTIDVDRVLNEFDKDHFYQELFCHLSWSSSNNALYSKEEIINMAMAVGLDEFTSKEISHRYYNALLSPDKIMIEFDQKSLLNKLLTTFGYYKEDIKEDLREYHVLSIPGRNEYYLWLYLLGSKTFTPPIVFQFYLQPDQNPIIVTSKNLHRSEPFTAIKSDIHKNFQRTENKSLHSFHGFSIYLFEEVYKKHHQQKWNSVDEKRDIQTFYLSLLHQLNQIKTIFSIDNHYLGFNPDNIEWSSVDDENPWTFWRSTRKQSHKKLS